MSNIKNAAHQLATVYAVNQHVPDDAEIEALLPEDERTPENVEKCREEFESRKTKIDGFRY